jgi:hypothetical protein
MFTNIPEILATSSIITLMIEAASTSGTLVNIYQTTQHYNIEDRHLYKQGSYPGRELIWSPLCHPSNG